MQCCYTCLTCYQSGNFVDSLAATFEFDPIRRESNGAQINISQDVGIPWAPVHSSRPEPSPEPTAGFQDQVLESKLVPCGFRTLIDQRRWRWRGKAMSVLTEPLTHGILTESSWGWQWGTQAHVASPMSGSHCETPSPQQSSFLSITRLLSRLWGYQLLYL